ncbi:MAG: LysR family transcriptional regulator [Rhodobacter sp.]|nr:LysR family transcriptional regulator [Rhodobacter sp.]
MIPLHRIDLNLLSLLIEIHDCGSVSQAGRKLGLSQPASSNALARLRQSLGEPLFVRGKNRMLPTAFTSHIAPQIRLHLAGISNALTKAGEFDPRTSTRTFRLSLSGLGEQIFMPSLAQRIHARAPGAILSNVAARLSDLAQSLAAQEADAAIGILDLKDRNIRQTHLFDEVYRAVGNPGLPRDRIETIDLARARIILVAPSATYAQNIEDALDRHGWSENICLRLRHFGALPEVLQKLDAVAIVPGQLATRLERSGQASILPAELPLGRHQVKLVWHQHTDLEPGCIWLRRQICELFQKPARTDP